MSRIVLAAMGSLGDLHPLIAIALTLQQRGHDLVFATHREYQNTIESLGLKFHRLRPDTALGDPQEIERMMDLKEGTKRGIQDWICGNLRNTYSDLLTCCQNTDFIIATGAVLAARLVAEVMDIPWASAVYQPSGLFSVHDPSVLPLFPDFTRIPGLRLLLGRGLRQLAISMTQSWVASVHQLRQELNLPPLNGNPLIDDAYSPYLILAMFSATFAQPQPDWEDQTVQTGFAFYDGSGSAELDPELQQFLEAGEPPIVFTLGSTAVHVPGRFYEESIEAATHLNRRAVLLMGSNPRPANLPAHIIAIDYVPYSQIFPHARAVVHQGGIGTTAQALRAGCPTLVIPFSHDQPDNAARVQRLGTSLTLSRKRYSAKPVVKQLRKLLDNPRFAAQAQTIGCRIQAEDGVGNACDAIETCLMQTR